MQQITQTFTNLMTGEIRQEIWIKIDNNKYQAPDGYIYTKGVIGWFCLNPNKN